MRTAVYCGTRNLYPDMVTAVNSLLANGGADRVVLVIEDDVFPYGLPGCCETINVADQTYFRKGGPNYSTGWTWMVLMRTALSKLLPEEDRVLSLDVDTIVDGDISGLWDMDLSDYYLAAAREPGKSWDKMYVQMGVVLFNLKKLREDGMDDRIIEALNTRPYCFTDQDCINQMCEGHILEMDSKYNYNNYTVRTDDPQIYHFAAIREWRGLDVVKKYRVERPAENGGSYGTVLEVEEKKWQLGKMLEEFEKRRI